MCCVTTHAIAPYKVLTLGPFWGVDNFNFPARVFGESGTWQTCVFDARQHGGSFGEWDCLVRSFGFFRLFEFMGNWGAGGA